MPTRFFLGKPKAGEEMHIPIEDGKLLIVKLLGLGPFHEATGMRDVLFELNSSPRQYFRQGPQRQRRRGAS